MNQLRWTAIRDIFLFFAGIAGAAHEVVLTNTERPTLLILFAAMMGLPAVLRQDGKGGSIGPPPTPPPVEKPKEEKSKEEEKQAPEPSKDSGAEQTGG